MRSRIGAGAIAGLTAGIVAAALMSVMGITGREGGVVWVITLVAQTVGSNSVLVGWFVQLLMSTAMGAFFGVLFAALAKWPQSAAGWAVIYGIAWWIVGWLVMMPRALRLPPWSPNPSPFQIAVAGLLACLGYGAVLGGMFAWLRQRPRSIERSEHVRRAA